MPSFQHVVEHHVPSLKGIFRIYSGIVEGSCLEHTHKHCCLFCCQIFGRVAKICFAGSFDAKCIGTEIYGVGIHGKNLVFGEDALNFYGGNPFLALHDENLKPRNIAQ